ncbi:TPA: hypothetical protein ACXIZC_002806 [Serratia marcescens]
MTHTLTTDELRHIVANAKTSLEQYLALELLANRDMKPVGYVSESTLNCLKRMQTHEIITAKPEKNADSERDWDVIPVFIAPPAPAVPDNKAITPFFDTIALDTARMVMCDVNRRSDFLGGDIQLLARIQCRIDDACRAAMLAQPQIEPQNIPNNIPNGLAAAINRLLDSDGSRGCFSAVRSYDAREEIERLLAQPVSQGGKLTGKVREALTLALQAMEFMGDTLNNIDAVCTEDVEYVTPAFNAVRELLAAAPEGGNEK